MFLKSAYGASSDGVRLGPLIFDFQSNSSLDRRLYSEVSGDCAAEVARAKGFAKGLLIPDSAGFPLFEQLFEPNPTPP